MRTERGNVDPRAVAESGQPVEPCREREAVDGLGEVERAYAGCIREGFHALRLGLPAHGHKVTVEVMEPRLWSAEARLPGGIVEHGEMIICAV